MACLRARLKNAGIGVTLGIIARTVIGPNVLESRSKAQRAIPTRAGRTMMRTIRSTSTADQLHARGRKPDARLLLTFESWFPRRLWDDGRNESDR